MQTEEMSLRRGEETPGEAMATIADHPALGEKVSTDGWVADEQLDDSWVPRNPLHEREARKNLAVNALASGRRTVRLLWMALIASLMAHLIIPICIVTAMVRPEKVALMDGTLSL